MTKSKTGRRKVGMMTKLETSRNKEGRRRAYSLGLQTAGRLLRRAQAQLDQQAEQRGVKVLSSNPRYTVVGPNDRVKVSVVSSPKVGESNDLGDS